MKIRSMTLFLLSALLFVSCLDERQRPLAGFAMNNPSENGSRYPGLYSADGETLYMSWFGAIDENLFALEYASWKDGSWQNPQPVYMGGDLFSGWTDSPSVVPVDQADQADQEFVALHWLKKIEEGIPGRDIQVSFPSETARRWNHVTAHETDTPAVRSSVSMLPAGNGSILVIWLEGQPASLRSAVVHSDGTIGNERIVTREVCSFSTTDLARMEGRAVAVYEECADGEAYRISLAGYDLESGEWSSPSVVHSEAAERDSSSAAGPALAVHRNSVVVVWPVEKADGTGVRSAFSGDGGGTFGDPVWVGEDPVSGRADVGAAPDGTFYAVWLQREERMARVVLQAIGEGGRAGDPVPVGTTGRGEVSGFPELAALDDGVMLAWTQTEPFIQIRTAFYRYGHDIPQDEFNSE